MPEVDLLRALPTTRRDIQKREGYKDGTVVAIAKQLGKMYWFGLREYGYGRYLYNWPALHVVRDAITRSGFQPTSFEQALKEDRMEFTAEVQE